MYNIVWRAEPNSKATEREREREKTAKQVYIVVLSNREFAEGDQLWEIGDSRKSASEVEIFGVQPLA